MSEYPYGGAVGAADCGLGAPKACDPSNCRIGAPRGRVNLQHEGAHSRQGAGSRPRWWAHIKEATHITRERDPIYGLRVAMMVSPEEDVAAVQYRVSDLVLGAIALVGGPPTTPDWTVVDAESAVREDDAPEWTALHVPIPDHNALDDGTLARAVDDDTGRTVHGPVSGLTGEPVAVAREVPGYETFVVRAHRREWETLLGEATGWAPFEGDSRLVERILIAHSRRWIAGQLEGSGFGLPGTDAAISPLRSERPARDNDLAWLLAPDDSRNPPRETIDDLLRCLTHAAGAAGCRA